jgi:hypothetical protein
MRVRDYCRRSLEFLVQNKFLPDYLVTGPFNRGAPRPQAVFRPEQMIVAHYAVAEGPLYANRAAWDAAFKYIKSFTATGVGAAQKTCVLPQWCGIFAEFDTEDLLGLVSSALTQSGLTLKIRNDTARTATFEAQDDCKVSSLPEPYGKYLQLVQNKAGWDNPVQLRLLLNVRVVSQPAPPNARFRFQTHVDLDASTLAPPLLENAAKRLNSLLPARLQAKQLNLTSLSQSAVLLQAGRHLGAAPAPPTLYPVQRRTGLPNP